MHERRERKREHALGEERTTNKICLIISNILEKLSILIIPNRGVVTKTKSQIGKNTRFHTSAV
jgi:hypothetical protein